jgi:TadE-like protein
MAVIRLARGRHGQGGQTLVEFALAVPIFALVFFGLFDVGKLVYTNSVLSQAAREGARLGATEAAWIGVPGDGCVTDAASISSGNPGAHVCPTDVTTFKANIVTAVNRMIAGVGAISAVHISCNDGSGLDPAPAGAWTESAGGNACHDGTGNAMSSTGDLVSVRVEFTYQPITPIISSIIGSVPLSGSSTMVIN